MLRIKRKDITVEKSELLYEMNFFTQEKLERDFEIAGGIWECQPDGSIISFTERDNGGLIYSKEHFKGDILIDFWGKTVPPYNNDMNFTFCSNGWNYEKDVPREGYIGGLQGWWLGKTGLEKCPYELNIGAMTGMHNFETDKYYHIQAGRIGICVFIFIDGELAVEMEDPEPHTDFGRVGLGSYASKIQFRDFKVYRPYYEPFVVSYKKLRELGMH